MAQAILNVIDHGMTLQEAFEAPRVWTEGAALELEDGFANLRRPALSAGGAGPPVKVVEKVAGGMNGVLVDAARAAARRGLLARGRRPDRRERRPGPALRTASASPPDPRGVPGRLFASWMGRADDQAGRRSTRSADGWRSPMNQPTAEAMLNELDQFVGEWTMTAGPPDGPTWPGEARIRFEWLDGRAFLVERWRLDGPGLPEGTPTSGTQIYGCDTAHAIYFQLYHDDRGVHRVYEMSIRAGEWTLRREVPPFAQRFSGRFSADGNTITGRWEIKEAGEEWRIDFDVTYTRVT